jgi:hypothetical protein
MDSNHYYPTSLSMLSQCLRFGYQVSQPVMQKTIDSVIEMVSQYSNLTKTFYDALTKIRNDVLKTTVYANLFVLLRSLPCVPCNNTFSGMLWNPILWRHLRRRTMLS